MGSETGSTANETKNSGSRGKALRGMVENTVFILEKKQYGCCNDRNIA